MLCSMCKTNIRNKDTMFQYIFGMVFVQLCYNCTAKVSVDIQHYLDCMRKRSKQIDMEF